MPAPRIVFCDMDGTLLASDKSIPALNMHALECLAQRGIPFVPCTGRPASAVPEEVRSHAAVRYVIAANGAVVEDLRERVRLQTRGIDKDRVLALYERVRTWPITFDVFADGSVYSERPRYDSMGSLGIDPATLEMLRRVRIPVDRSVPQIVEEASCIEKLTCFFGDLGMRDRLMMTAREVGGLSYASGDPCDVELMAPDVSKRTALTWLCNHLGIEASDAVAFGDEQNDASMLYAAGCGVAMKNAHAEVIQAADCLAPSNDDAGVGRFLLQMLR